MTKKQMDDALDTLGDAVGSNGDMSQVIGFGIFSMLANIAVELTEIKDSIKEHPDGR